MSEHSLSDELESELKVIERTIKILDVVKKEQPIGISKLSEKMGIEEHKIRYSLRLLQKDKIIEPTSHGASLTEKHEKFENELIEDLQEMEQTIEEMIEMLQR
ncbi:MAG: transcriptional regulator [Candidatus Thermoplasmatota archaeon]|nr:transcriptional regulator [Candidatus Thermoplasmatota archaeon]MBS3790933.1 transcriptional regulator [Candidatus Thermoplasmatota archaeon]